MVDKRRVSLLVLLGLTLAPWVAPAQELSKLIVFGDSLSDNGNAFSGSGGTAPSPTRYWRGRFSDGPVWADYVRALLNVELQNRAYAGSETGKASSSTGAPGLLQQVDGFIASQNGKLAADAAIVIWSGSNDMLRIPNAGRISPVVDGAVANIMRAIDRLRAAGAKKVVVANVPDLGRVPLADDNVLALSSQQVTQAANLFNARLKAAIETRQHKVVIFNAFAAHRAIIANPTQVGLKNVSQGCLENGCQSGSASGPSDYLYWDSLHPTTKGHRIIADDIARGALTRLAGDSVGLYNPANSQFRLDQGLKGSSAELKFSFDSPAKKKTGLAGDWKGTGRSGIGTYHRDKRQVRLRLSNSSGAANIKYKIKDLKKRMLPITGDWDGNGTVTLGFYDPPKGMFLLKNKHNKASPELKFRFGPKKRSWQPLSGDWDGDGKDTVGLHDPDTGIYYYRNINGKGKTSLVGRFGPAGGAHLVLAGDWDSDGVDGVGAYYRDRAQFFLRDSLASTPVDFTVSFGTKGANWLPVSGAWVQP